MDSVNRTFGCGVVRAWEECIWLDRRELACAQPPVKRGFLGRIGAWFHVARTRMQLGPAHLDGWAGADPDKPF